MAVAEVDHGNETATPTASQSITAVQRLRSKTDSIGRLVLRGAMALSDFRAL
jgi:hypothetical protein